MATRAARGGVNAPLFLKFFSCVSLDGSRILVFACTRNPREVGYLAYWSQGVLGMAMAIETEGHAQRLGMPHLIHLVHLAVVIL